MLKLSSISWSMTANVRLSTKLLKLIVSKFNSVLQFHEVSTGIYMTFHGAEHVQEFSMEEEMGEKLFDIEYDLYIPFRILTDAMMNEKAVEYVTIALGEIMEDEPNFTSELERSLIHAKDSIIQELKTNPNEYIFIDPLKGLI